MTRITTNRYDAVREYMAQNGIDCIFVNSPENFKYFSGYHNPDGYMVISDEEAVAFSDFRYIEAARNESFANCGVEMLSDGAAAKYISNKGFRTVAIENEKLTVRQFASLKKQLEDEDCTFVDLGSYFDLVRSVKDDYEVESIVRAQRIAEKALDHVLGILTPDMTETEVAAELEYQMKKNGSENPAFDTIAVSGKASSVPHGVPRNVKLEKGFLTMDFGAKINGYCSDMTRTVCIGKADDDMKRLYDTVLKAQLAAIEAIGPGSDSGNNDKIARDIINNAGYEGCFGHSLGHGVGLLIHELPNQSVRTFGKKLVPGNIVTAEPGIYVEGKYGCRIEDMILVTETGNRDLTEAPKELIEI